ncbi:MAG: uroporphyrinogen decarboxylase family protein, partial [SAR324 cluster bacterium]|nr:uroporphyrinogen decarboxylase family protein [SAR324 cluster bacterium]
MSVIKNDRLLRVLNHLPVDRVPVWMMRQAGRTDPEYNQLKKNDGRALEKIFADPEVSIKISLLPKRLGVDAIIMFQDILTPLTPAGSGFNFAPGPILERPIRT